MKPRNKAYVVSVSFVNYLQVKTGMPKVMLAHQQMYNREGISYVGLFTSQKTILDDRVTLFCKFGLLIDGQFCGIYQMSQLINMFADWSKEGCSLWDIHIHHLLGVNTHRMDELLGSFPDVPIKVYLHDYHLACVNYTLMKNGRDYCGGKGLDMAHCGDCPSYEKSLRVQKSIHGLYKKYSHRILFVSPSPATRNIFLNFHPEYAEQTMVIPHQTFQVRYRENLESIGENEKIRVAYLGMPEYHKGWETWNRLVAHADPEQYEFIVFNSVPGEYAGMRKVTTSFTQQALNAMTAALRENRVHVAVLWAMCPETYSYTCFEAYAANALLITREGSGNVADAVKLYECGLVLPAEEALMALFDHPDAMRQQINAYRAKTPGGPLELKENSRIIDITRQGRPEKTNCKRLRKPVDYPLLWLLNKKHSHKNNCPQ